MNAHTPSMTRRLGLAALVAAGALMTAACEQRQDSASVGEKVDQAVAAAKQEGQEAQRQMSEAGASAQQSMSEAAQAAQDKGHDLASKVDDAAITASINAKLAEDKDLKVAQIDVDTKSGHVRLAGKAPTVEARERATLLAEATEGVVGVENDLRIGS